MFYNVRISTVEHRYNLEINRHIMEVHAQNFFSDRNIHSRVWAN